MDKPDYTFEDFIWDFLVPQACEKCRQRYMRDQTDLAKGHSGRLAVKCAHCGNVVGYGLMPLPRA